MSPNWFSPSSAPAIGSEWDLSPMSASPFNDPLSPTYPVPSIAIRSQRRYSRPSVSPYAESYAARGILPTQRYAAEAAPAPVLAIPNKPRVSVDQLSAAPALHQRMPSDSSSSSSSSRSSPYSTSKEPSPAPSHGSSSSSSSGRQQSIKFISVNPTRASRTQARAASKSHLHPNIPQPIYSSTTAIAHGSTPYIPFATNGIKLSDFLNSKKALQDLEDLVLQDETSHTATLRLWVSLLSRAIIAHLLKHHDSGQGNQSVAQRGSR
jgi:hypothetical protein